MKARDLVLAIDRLLESKLVWQDNPTAELARVALIRELSAAEQMAAMLRDAHSKVARLLVRESKVYRAQCECARLNGYMAKKALNELCRLCGKGLQ